ncbi:MAG: HDOD domain-containing protein [Methylotenera sp.]|nr:HDOD domain-containing protein [Methylotenera sp.]
MVNKIDRFEVQRKLAESTQGAVYLARDPHLDREVVIKTLSQGSGNMDVLLPQVRIVSKLQHHNIITLFDAGEHDNATYLVYAYIEGLTLAQLLKANQTLPVTQAVQIICGVLEGVAYAHQQGIVHLDLQPANIMIAENNQPLIMNFSIAPRVAEKSGANSKIDARPLYAAPEISSDKGGMAPADIFSLGIILQTLVTGTPVKEAEKSKGTQHTKNSVVNPPAPVYLDEQLEEIILKATAENPENRFSDANAMQIALQNYLSPSFDKGKSSNKHSTLDFLLRRMHNKSDFPALSHTISEINKVADDDSASSNILAQSILNDFALTNKLLKLVNTVTYGQFGGQINTISKAVVILGFETVRNVAMTLILLDFLQNKAQAAQLKDDVLAAFFAGIVATQFSSVNNIRNAEETMICSMFRNLGKLLASFYFFEESQQVARLVAQGETEDKASMQVLGIDYNELGIGIAKSWNFPPRLIAGMRKQIGAKIAKPHGELENLSVTVNLANELCAIANSGNVSDKPKALKHLSKRYENAISISEQQLRKAMESGLNELAARARIIGVDITQSMLMKRVNIWVGARTEEVANTTASESSDLDGLTPLGISVENADEKISNPPKVDSESILADGIQEITNTLVEDHKLNDIMQMVLETMHRGMGFNRTILMVRDVKANQMLARFGFGQDIDVALTKFHFNLDFTPDVFHLAMSKGADLLLEDITAENVTDKIPSWYKQAVSSQSFLLLPVMVNSKPIGLFYADVEHANTMQVSTKQLSLLRTLRNQSVLAIKQKG